MPANLTATGAGGAVVSFATTATDIVDTSVTVVCTSSPTAGLVSGSTFPVGTTTITCTATDDYANATTKIFTVTVSSASVPVCTAAVASPSFLWPPNHKFSSISINGITNADGKSVTINVTSIFQDEPTQGLGDGDTPIDGVISNGAAQVRAERSGLGNGRVYYLNFTATAVGGSCTGTVTVSVPHDQAHPAVGDGPKYDSTKSSSAAGDDCHGNTDHGHHDGDGCLPGHHGHYDGDNCQRNNGRENNDSYHHDGDGDGGGSNGGTHRRGNDGEGDGGTRRREGN